MDYYHVSRVAFFSLLLTVLSCIEPLSADCNNSAIEIKFPFSLKAENRGFQLSCRENQKTNTTVIHFPSYRDLIVTKISYDTKRIHLLDPSNCVHEVFLNLDLSQTPFSYYYKLKNYTYLNCSSSLSTPFVEIPCMSSERFHVYTVELSQSPLPDSCKRIKTVSIPFMYSCYLSDNTFGLELRWDLPGCKECEAEGGQCRNQDEKVWCFYTRDEKIRRFFSFSVVREWMNWFVYLVSKM